MRSAKSEVRSPECATETRKHGNTEARSGKPHALLLTCVTKLLQTVDCGLLTQMAHEFPSSPVVGVGAVVVQDGKALLEELA